ncbi:MAG: recombination protein RecR [Candidatus Nealsonbacteria bacterium]|nr:recombination protein RecR [Candidatus Nealsonbacteria bacterium]
MYSPSIQKLIEQFSKFPTVGPRTAVRFVFHLLKLPKEELGRLSESISSLQKEVKLCSFCFRPFEPFDAAQGCEICSDIRRDKALLCVVEKETDLETIEKTKKYQGRYFILGGTVSKLMKEDIEKLRIKELQERARDVKEIILATNPTTEGEATALYLERTLKPLNIKTTRLGRGLPVGGELEYADEETLGSSLDNRK